MPSTSWSDHRRNQILIKMFTWTFINNTSTLYILGTHGITFEEAKDENSDDEGTSQQCTIECDVPFQQLQTGEFNLIYSHPEALMKTRFAKVLRSKVYQETVCAVVIDEVHMISEW